MYFANRLDELGRFIELVVWDTKTNGQNNTHGSSYTGLRKMYLDLDKIEGKSYNNTWEHIYYLGDYNGKDR